MAARDSADNSSNAGDMFDTLSIRIGVLVSVLPVQIIVSVL